LNLKHEKPKMPELRVGIMNGLNVSGGGDFHRGGFASAIRIDLIKVN
jgi:hypothetical protein